MPSRGRRAFWLVLLLPLLLGAGRRLDLSGQFPDPACRDQKDVGSCHAFGAVALLEAAIYRKHEEPGGSRVRLSEADLFVGNTVRKENFSQGLVATYFRGYPDDAFVDSFRQANYPVGDLKFGIDRGVALAEAEPYEVFLRKYRPFRKEKRRATAKVLRRCKDMLKASTAWLRTATGFADDSDPRWSRFAEDCEAEGFRMENEADAIMREFLARQTEEIDNTAEDRLLNADAAAQAGRAWTKDLMAGFTVKKKDFVSYFKDLYDKPGCAKQGADRLANLYSLFKQGIPVGVSMDLGGLRAWGKRPPARGEPHRIARHAFLVTGFR